MKIKTLLNTNIAIVSLSLISLFFITTKLTLLHEQSSKAEIKRFNSYRLANQLKQSSDDLTRMVRTYVVTGDIHYKQYFDTILDIRNGKSPRPDNYDQVFWDFIIPSINDYIPSGKKISLHQMLDEWDFSKDEITMLKMAQDNSDKLVNLEREAMNALVGKYKDNDGKFTKIGPPNQRFAMDLVHGIKYHQAKSIIMKPIALFLENVNRRTSQDTQRINDTQESMIILF